MADSGTPGPSTRKRRRTNDDAVTASSAAMAGKSPAGASTAKKRRGSKAIARKAAKSSTGGKRVTTSGKRPPAVSMRGMPVTSGVAVTDKDDDEEDDEDEEEEESEETESTSGHRTDDEGETETKDVPTPDSASHADVPGEFSDDEQAEEVDVYLPALETTLIDPEPPLLGVGSSSSAPLDLDVGWPLQGNTLPQEESQQRPLSHDNSSQSLSVRTATTNMSASTVPVCRFFHGPPVYDDLTLRLMEFITAHIHTPNIEVCLILLMRCQ